MSPPATGFLACLIPPVTLAAATALLLYLPTRRSRYFGNTVPLLLALLFFTLITPGIASEPTLWALPFLFTFIAGVFADFLETRYRPVFLGVAVRCWFLKRLSAFFCCLSEGKTSLDSHIQIIQIKRLRLAISGLLSGPERRII